MAEAAIAQALALIEQLDTDELQQVQQAIEGRLKQHSETAAWEAFHRALLASGLVNRVKTVRPGTTGEPPLVPIQGQPLSETILAERR